MRGMTIGACTCAQLQRARTPVLDGLTIDGATRARAVVWVQKTCRALYATCIVLYSVHTECRSPASLHASCGRPIAKAAGREVAGNAVDSTASIWNSL